MVVVADLVARVSAQGAQEAAAQVKAVGQEATTTARALEIMAAQYAKLHGGTAAGALEMFNRAGVQPTAAALAEAAKSAERTAAAVTAVVEPSRAAAAAAAEHAKGWTASESSLVRFGAGIAGVGLGISLVAGAARLAHQAIVDVVDAQLAWERSLVSVHALYGSLGPQILATAQAQAFAPGMAGTAQDFTQAALNARFLSSRYGLPQSDITALTSAAGRAAGTLNLDPAATQAAFLQAVESGGTGLRTITGTELDPLSIARRLGGTSATQIQALTPAQLAEVRTQAIAQDAARLALSGNQDRPGLLAAQTQARKALTEAQTRLQTELEGNSSLNTGIDPRGGGFGSGPGFQVFSTPRELGAPPRSGFEGAPPAGQVLSEAVKAAQQAFADATKAVGDNQKALDDSTAALAKLGVEAGTAAFRLLGFAGSVEDRYSIARGDIGAAAQAAVTARARSAIPLAGQPLTEISNIARGTAYQQVWQNFVAQQAQADQDNAIREHLQNLVQLGPGSQRPAAQRALDQAQALQPINARIGQAQQVGAAVDLAAADTQAKLETISLTQRERYVQLMRDTVDLRKLDVQQQQASVAATQEVIRAQQTALSAQYALSNAQYQGNLAGALAQQRMGRVLRGQSVAGLPSIDELIQMNVNAQFATAEAGPAALTAGRAVELAQRTATSAGLAQQLTAGQIQNTELANDLKNLGDLPTQTGLQLESIQLERDSLKVQQELRDLTKDLVNIMKGHPASMTSDQGIQDIANRLGVAIFGDGGGDSGAPAPSDLPGARRGPF